MFPMVPLRNEQRVLLAEEVRRDRLQPVDCRIFALPPVSRPSSPSLAPAMAREHFRGWQAKRIAAKIDDSEITVAHCAAPAFRRHATINSISTSAPQPAPTPPRKTLPAWGHRRTPGRPIELSTFVISVTNTVVLRTISMEESDASRRSRRLDSALRTCPLYSVSSLPVSGFRPSWPERKMRFPNLIPCDRGLLDFATYLIRFAL